MSSHIEDRSITITTSTGKKLTWKPRDQASVPSTPNTCQLTSSISQNPASTSEQGKTDNSHKLKQRLKQVLHPKHHQQEETKALATGADASTSTSQGQPELPSHSLSTSVKMGLINIAKFCGRTPGAYEQFPGEETPETFSDWPSQGQKYEGRGTSNKYCACPTSILSPCRDRYNPADGILYRRSNEDQASNGTASSPSSSTYNTQDFQSREFACSTSGQWEEIDTGFIQIQPAISNTNTTSELDQQNHLDKRSSFLLPKRLLNQKWYNQSLSCSPNQRDGNIGTEVKDKAYISTHTEEDWIKVTIEESPVLSPTLGLDEDISELSLPESEFPLPGSNPIPCQRNSRDNIEDMSDSLFTLPSSMENTQLLREIQELGLERISMDNVEDEIWCERSGYFARDTRDEGKQDEGYISENPEMIISQDLRRDWNPNINRSQPPFRGRSVSAPELRLLPSYRCSKFDVHLIQQSSRPVSPLSESGYELHNLSAFTEDSYPIHTPYPALDSSATTLDFGFRPTLENMPRNRNSEDTNLSSEYNRLLRTQPQPQPQIDNNTNNTKGEATAENQEYKLVHLRGGAKTPSHTFDTFFDIFHRTRKEERGKESIEVGKRRLDKTMGLRDWIIAGQWGKQPPHTWREFIGAGRRGVRKRERRERKGKRMGKEGCGGGGGGGDGNEVCEKAVVHEENVVVGSSKDEKSLEEVDMKSHESEELETKVDESKDDKPKDDLEKDPEKVQSASTSPKEEIKDEELQAEEENQIQTNATSADESPKGEDAQGESSKEQDFNEDKSSGDELEEKLKEKEEIGKKGTKVQESSENLNETPKDEQAKAEESSSQEEKNIGEPICEKELKDEESQNVEKPKAEETKGEKSINEKENLDISSETSKEPLQNEDKKLEDTKEAEVLNSESANSNEVQNEDEDVKNDESKESRVVNSEALDPMVKESENPKRVEPKSGQLEPQTESINELSPDEKTSRKSSLDTSTQVIATIQNDKTEEKKSEISKTENDETTNDKNTSSKIPKSQQLAPQDENKNVEAESDKQSSMEKLTAGTQILPSISNESKKTEDCVTGSVKPATEDSKLDKSNGNDITPEKHSVNSEELKVDPKPLNEESNTDDIQAAQEIEPCTTDEVKKSEGTTIIKVTESKEKDENNDIDNDNGNETKESNGEKKDTENDVKDSNTKVLLDGEEEILPASAAAVVRAEVTEVL